MQFIHSGNYTFILTCTALKKIVTSHRVFVLSAILVQLFVDDSKPIMIKNATGKTQLSFTINVQMQQQELEYNAAKSR